MRNYFSLFFFVLTCVFVGLAFGQDAAPELGEAVTGLLAAFKNGAAPAAIVLAIVKLCRTKFLGNVLNGISTGLLPLIVLIGGLISGVLTELLAGKSFTAALIQGLFNGGFSITLYDVLVKHFFKKTEPGIL